MQKLLLPNPQTKQEICSLLKSLCKCSICHEQILGKVYCLDFDEYNRLVCDLCADKSNVTECSDEQAMNNFGIYLQDNKIFVSEGTRILCSEPKPTMEVEATKAAASILFSKGFPTHFPQLKDTSEPLILPTIKS